MARAHPPRHVNGPFSLIHLFAVAVLWRFAGIPHDIIKTTIIPGTATVILMGNIYFWWQGRCLARRERRHDVCAQPFGINTPDVFSFIFNIMAVVAKQRGHVDAYSAGLVANLMSGVVTIAGCRPLLPPNLPPSSSISSIFLRLSLPRLRCPSLACMYVGISPTIDAWRFSAENTKTRLVHARVYLCMHASMHACTHTQELSQFIAMC